MATDKHSGSSSKSSSGKTAAHASSKGEHKSAENGNHQGRATQASAEARKHVAKKGSKA